MNRFTVSFDIVAAIAVSVTLQLAPVAAEAATVRTVALTYQPAPGTSNGESYGQFNAPVINDHGQTAFWANLGGNNYDGGIWSEGSGSLALVARAGNQAPGTPDGATYFLFTPLPTSCGGFCTSRWLGSPVLLDDEGHTAFTALLGGADVTSSNGTGIWSERSGSLRLVARKGSQAPTAPVGVVFTSEFFPNPSAEANGYAVAFPRLNAAGHTAFYAAAYSSTAGTSGIWSESSGGLSLAANLPAVLSMPTFNDVGQTAFSQNTPWYSDIGGVWLETSGGSAVLAAKSAHAPGTPAGVNFGSYYHDGLASTLAFGVPGLNNQGQVAFRAFLTGSGVDSTNSNGIWSNESGSLALVARAGDQAPGLPSGAAFQRVSSVSSTPLGPDGRAAFGDPVLNNAGQIAFRAGLSNGGTGVWATDSAGELELIARTGDLLNGARFNIFSDPVLNDAGQVAFYSRLCATLCSLTSGYDSIWATDRSGALRLVVRAGDVLEVAPGELRTISELWFMAGTGNSDGRASGFNNLGQLAFWARFSCGREGIFVSNAVAHFPGDFNDDGTVDGADYVVWRKGLGTIYTQDDFNVWKSNFGATLGAGGSSSALNPAVPEPASLLLVALAAMTLGGFRRRFHESRVCRFSRLLSNLIQSPAAVIGGLP
jgi:hypothetical protein